MATTHILVDLLLGSILESLRYLALPTALIYYMATQIVVLLHLLLPQTPHLHSLLVLHSMLSILPESDL